MAEFKYADACDIGITAGEIWGYLNTCFIPKQDHNEFEGFTRASTSGDRLARSRRQTCL